MSEIQKGDKISIRHCPLVGLVPLQSCPLAALSPCQPCPLPTVTLAKNRGEGERRQILTADFAGGSLGLWSLLVLVRPFHQAMAAAKLTHSKMFDSP